jgi:trans-2-enoyl-CoA reductase
VLLNAANSTVGQLVIQLCHLLRLRAIAVISSEPDFAKTSLALKALGAAEVLLDSGSLKASAHPLQRAVGSTAGRTASKHAGWLQDVLLALLPFPPSGA